MQTHQQRGDAIRWLYIKNGDAEQQVRRITADPKYLPRCGPNAFIADFLQYVSGQPALILSLHRRSAKCIAGPVKAYVFKAESTSPVSRIAKVLLCTHAVFRSALLIGAFHPDRIVCGRAGLMLWLVFLYSKLWMIPLVHARHNSLHQSRPFPLHRFLHSAIDRWVMRRCCAIVCHGPFIKQQLRKAKIDPRKIHEFEVCLDGFSKEHSHFESESTKQTNAWKPFILFAGRIEAQKGVFDLLAALTPRLRHDEKLKLVFVGDGSAKADLQQRVNRLGLAKQIILTGGISHEDMPPILSAAQILAIPTRPEFPEGRCMVMLEGFACGVPVVAPDFGPFRQMIVHLKNGLLFVPASVKDLKVKLETLLDDPELRMKTSYFAAATGRQMTRPALTFSQAVNRALKSNFRPRDPNGPLRQTPA